MKLDLNLAPSTLTQFVRSLRPLWPLWRLLALPCVLAACLATSSAAPLGTAFTYSGRLKYQNIPANGTFDLEVKLYDAANGGNQAGQLINVNGLSIVNGLFVTSLDFGSGIFNGTAYWLDIAARPSGNGPFTPLSPRQPINPSPYALYALTPAGPQGPSGPTGPKGDKGDPGATGPQGIQGTQGAIGPTGLTGATGPQGVKGDKGDPGATGPQGIQGTQGAIGPTGLTGTTGPQGVKGDKGDQGDPGATGPTGPQGPQGPAGADGSLNAWSLTGNAGTTAGVNFLGTTDDQPLEFWVNNNRGLRLEYAGYYNFQTRQGFTAVNTIGGFAGNQVLNGAHGVTIAGGGYVTSGLTGGNYPNQIGGGFGSIGGGANNSVAGLYGTVPGGHNNQANGTGSFAAGENAKADHDGSFIFSDGQLVSTTGPNSFDVHAGGGLHLGPTTSIYCGNQTRQMLNLWAAEYGIGVQALTLYFRSYAAFAWHREGSHVDGYTDPGPGGKTLMTLDDNYLMIQGGGGEQAYVGGDGVGDDVQFGSLNPNIRRVVMWNPSSSSVMDLIANDSSVRTLTITGGSDLAEPFQISGDDEISKGSVVIIDADHPGKLKLSSTAYDLRVAGVISGAGGVQPGIQMSQKGVLEGSENVALSGRVYVKADAAYGAISAGDLLTTSNTPGHAMKVSDHARASGAILGKAMSSLADGQGLVLVLVTLQ